MHPCHMTLHCLLGDVFYTCSHIPGSVSPCIHLFAATLSKLIFRLLALAVCPRNTPGGRRGANQTCSLSVPSFLTCCFSFFWALFKHAERHTQCRAEITISHTAETCADSVAPKDSKAARKNCFFRTSPMSYVTLSPDDVGEMMSD